MQDEELDTPGGAPMGNIQSTDWRDSEWFAEWLRLAKGH